MKTLVVHILSTEQEKLDEAFDIVREALGDKGIDTMLFECETLREAAIVLAEQADKREPAPATPSHPAHSVFGHMYGEFDY